VQRWELRNLRAIYRRCVRIRRDNDRRAGDGPTIPGDVLRDGRELQGCVDEEVSRDDQLTTRRERKRQRGLWRKPPLPFRQRERREAVECRITRRERKAVGILEDCWKRRERCAVGRGAKRKHACRRKRTRQNRSDATAGVGDRSSRVPDPDGAARFHLRERERRVATRRVAERQRDLVADDARDTESEGSVAQRKTGHGFLRAQVRDGHW
jgi:hypothetical protein